MPDKIQPSIPIWVRSASSGILPDQSRVLLELKIVPGARQDGFGGVLGSRLKVRVSAPAEGGKANKAVCALIAKTIGLKRGAVRIVLGHTSPEKTVQIDGVDPATVTSALGRHCA